MSQMRGLLSCDLEECLRAPCWFCRQQDTSSDTVGHILCVIGHVAKHLPKSTCDRLKGEWPWSLLCPHQPLKSFENVGFVCGVVRREHQELVEGVAVSPGCDQPRCRGSAEALPGLCGWTKEPTGGTPPKIHL